MKIKKGDKVKVEYTGSLDDGTVFDTSQGKAPLEFEVGSGKVIKGFDSAIIGMEKGEEKTIKIKPEESYGDVKPELIIKIPKKNIPEDAKENSLIVLKSPDGKQFPARIIEIKGDEASVDLNHPLAGKDLNFKIKVVDIS